MGYWSTRGLRGSTFEEMINMTNDMYREKGLALIQKIPTSITPTKLDQATRTITQAYFERKSTVDYIGVVQGIPVCFDAKETTLGRFPLQNIHEHQVAFMETFERQKGVAFCLVHFAKEGKVFYLPFKTLKKQWNAAKLGGRKSIPYAEFDQRLIVPMTGGSMVHYLDAMNIALAMRNGT